MAWNIKDLTMYTSGYKGKTIKELAIRGELLVP